MKIISWRILWHIQFLTSQVSLKNVGQEGEKLQKYEYLKNQKSVLVEMKAFVLKMGTSSNHQ